MKVDSGEYSKAGEGVPESAAAGGIDLVIDSDATVSYASYQNAVPLVHEIVITNRLTEPLRDVDVVLYASPDFAEPLRFRFARLEPGEQRRIAPVDLRLRHGFLADLTEANRGGCVRVAVRAGETLVASAEALVEVLAYDQWGGTRSILELLVAFSQPNNPAVDRLLHDAGRMLGERGQSIGGYRSKNRGEIWAQISAAYSAVAARGLQYSLPPASFAQSGQKIRTADRVLEGGVGTCLDLTMLLVSCLEQMGLNPLVLLQDGHSWVGCWLVNTCFPGCVVDDAQAVRKRVDAGEMVAFETTGLTHRPAATLRIACDEGKALLHDASTRFIAAIDVRRARQQHIQPLPSRGEVASREVLAEGAAPAIEPTPALPALLTDPVLLEEADTPNTPEGRLARWQAKLLDLTLHNRLLNFRASRLSIPLVVPDPAALEDALASGAQWKLRARARIMEGDDPREREIARQRAGGEDPVDAMARDAMSRHELLSTLDTKKLDAQLYEIFLAVRTALEEGGANTLFLALGFLRWTEDERAEKIPLSPILLVPVTLNRASVRTGFSIARHDDDTLVNPTLLQMLRETHGIELRGLDPLPMDEHGVDVNRLLAIFREAVKEIPRWEVVPDVCLGVFSFSKYLLWKDLRDRTTELKRNRVVGHLIDHAREPMRSVRDIAYRDDLDDRHAPSALLTPMLADSSQLNAVSRAGEGHDLVLQGPPGTGKSQTVVNLIAHYLGTGRTVLFVSQKAAALNVVERRLKQIGLDRFCLQIHSAKAKKTEVLEQLRSARDITLQRSSDDWEREAERLGSLRSELNGLVRALHFEHPNGLSVRQALDKAIAHPDWTAVPMDLPSIDAADQRQLTVMTDVAESLQAVLGELGVLAEHPLRAVLHREWSNGFEERLMQAGVKLTAAGDRVETAYAAIAGPLGLMPDAASMRMLNNAEALAEVLLRSAEVPPGFAGRADEPPTRQRLAYIRERAQKRNAAWALVADQLAPAAAQVPAIGLAQQWIAAAAKWWAPRLLEQNRVRTVLTPYGVAGKPPARGAVGPLLDALVIVNQEDDALRMAESDARNLLGDSYRGLTTDWDAVARHEAWAKGFDAVLQRFVSLDRPEQRLQIAARVRTLVTEQRSLLAPGGGLAPRLTAFCDALAGFRRALAEAQEISGNAQLLGGDSFAAGALTRARGVVQGWVLGREHLRQWCKWRDLRGQALTVGLGRVVDRLEGGELGTADLAEYVAFTFNVWWVKGVIDREPPLRTFSSADHERKILSFRAADERFQKLTEAYIFARLAAGVPDPEGATRQSEMGILNREIEKRRQHLAVRKLFQSMPTLLRRLKPCLLMSPLSVAQYLDPSFPPFDLVVMDESSQLTTPDAVGAIARGTQLVVIGDPKQLPPPTFFERSESDDDAGGEDEESPVKDLESILDEVLAAGMSRLSLDFHYRSRAESLIHFSNTRYYDSRLVTFPSPATRDDAVRLVRVEGIYDRGGSRTNRVEAEAIVARIVGHFNQQDPEARKPTMGVVTFNLPQMKLIEQLLNTEMLRNPDLEERIKAHGDERLLIKNIEAAQGDERDIFLFSITYGRDQAGRFPMTFGPIGLEGGHRRLNVAVTRARLAVEVYASISAGDIDLSRTRARGVADLKAYLDYAARGARAIAEEALPTGREPDSPFEREIIRVLRDAGWQVHPQVGCSGYRIDIGVVDQGQPGAYLVGVECDGATYHSLPTARDRDRLRQSILEGLGWELLRVWSTDWWSSRQFTAQALVKKVAALQARADQKRAAARVGG